VDAVINKIWRIRQFSIYYCLFLVPCVQGTFTQFDRIEIQGTNNSKAPDVFRNLRNPIKVYIGYDIHTNHKDQQSQTYELLKFASKNNVQLIVEDRPTYLKAFASTVMDKKIKCDDVVDAWNEDIRKKIHTSLNNKIQSFENTTKLPSGLVFICEKAKKNGINDNNIENVDTHRGIRFNTSILDKKELMELAHQKAHLMIDFIAKHEICKCYDDYCKKQIAVALSKDNSAFKNKFTDFHVKDIIKNATNQKYINQHWDHIEKVYDHIGNKLLEFKVLIALEKHIKNNKKEFLLLLGGSHSGYISRFLCQYAYSKETTEIEMRDSLNPFLKKTDQASNLLPANISDVLPKKKKKYTPIATYACYGLVATIATIVTAYYCNPSIIEKITHGIRKTMSSLGSGIWSRLAAISGFDK
jgi:hypothetical protein